MRKLLLVLIFTLFFVYCGIFIYLSSFVIDGVRYFCLFDDGMISMQYAKNFAQNFLLAYSVTGDKVEGITNLLWVLYMSLWHLFNIPLSYVSIFIQLTGFVFLILNIIFLYKLSFLLSKDFTISILSTILVMSCYSLNFWALMGMEISILTFLFIFSLYIIFKYEFSDRALYLVLIIISISSLIRLDIYVLYFSILAYLFIYEKKSYKFFIISILIFLISLSSQTLFRYFYYGELLPNTFYLKSYNIPYYLRISRGIYIIILFFIRIIPVHLIFIVYFIVRCNVSKYLKMMFIVIIMQIFYVIYVGGDAWEDSVPVNRFIIVIIPLIFLIFLLTLKQLINYKNNFNKIILLLIVLLSIFISNFRFGFSSLRQLFLLNRNPNILINVRFVRTALSIKNISTENALVATSAAGAISYFSNRNMHDMLGKNDKHIAFMMINLDDNDKPFYLQYYPGHMKYDYKYSIKKLQPDIVVDPYMNKQYAKTYLKDNYISYKSYGSFKLYLLKNSEFILWDELDI